MIDHIALLTLLGIDGKPLHQMLLLVCHLHKLQPCDYVYQKTLIGFARCIGKGSWSTENTQQKYFTKFVMLCNILFYSSANFLRICNIHGVFRIPTNFLLWNSSSWINLKYIFNWFMNWRIPKLLCLKMSLALENYIGPIFYPNFTAHVQWLYSVLKNCHKTICLCAAPECPSHTAVN